MEWEYKSTDAESEDFQWKQTSSSPTRGATSSSFRWGSFHEFSFDDVIVFIQMWYNFFASGHRQSYLRNISENEHFLVLIRPVSRVVQVWAQFCCKMWGTAWCEINIAIGSIQKYGFINTGSQSYFLEVL